MKNPRCGYHPPQRLDWLAVCLLTLLALTGCATPQAGDPTPAATATPAPVAPVPPLSPVLNALLRSNSSERFEHLTVNDGLSQSTIYAILQDRRGFIWFGTDEGANRYDGSSFKVYRNDPDDPTSLGDNNVVALAEDIQGVLWVGTTGGGIFRFDTLSEQFTPYQHDPKDPASLAYNDVSLLLADRAGRLWAATPAGLERLDPGARQFTHYFFRTGQENGLSGSRIRALLEDRSGALWIATNGGLDRLEVASGKFTHWRADPALPEGLSSNSVRALYQTPDGRLWIGSSAGLDCLDPTTQAFLHYRHDPGVATSLPEGTLMALTGDAAGNLWLSFDSGWLARFDPTTGHFSRYANDVSDPYSISADELRSLYLDRQGILWIGTTGTGINKLSPTTGQFIHVRGDPKDPTSLSNSRIFAIYQDSQQGLWLGTIGGLDRLDLRTGQFTHFRNDPKNSDSLAGDFVSAILERRDGTFWIGVMGAGLDLYDPRTGKFTHYQPDSADPASLSGSAILALHEDASGGLWVGTNGSGLNRLDPKTGKFTRYLYRSDQPGGLPSPRVWSILEDGDGSLWLGTGAGLTRFDPKTETFQVFPSERAGITETDIFCIAKDRAGNLWLGTYGNGLKKFDRATGTFTHYRMKNGLPSDVVYGVLEDLQGRLWLSTNRGIARFTPQDGTFQNYDVIDGLQSNEFNTGAFFANAAGELFFGGINGLTAFRPEGIQDNLQVPPVLLTALTRHGEALKTGSALDAVQEVSLEWPENTFEFEFTALNLIRPEKNQYAFRLENFDRQWNVLGAKNSGRYTNLPGGDYTLHLRGANNSGLWNNTGTTLRIHVIPPFWERWWFQGGLVGLLGLAAVSGYRLRLRGIQQRNLQLERLVQLRTAEIEKRGRDMAAVYQADERLHKTLTVDQALGALLDVAVEMLQAEKCVVLTWDEAREMLQPLQSRGFSNGRVSQLACCRGEGLAGQVAANDQPVVINDTHSDPLYGGESVPTTSILAAEGVRSLAYLPIAAGEQVYGVFGVYSSRPGAFGEEVRRLFTALSQRAGLSVENALLFEQTRDVAVIEERARLARDLHDSAKQKAFAALAQLGAARGLARRDAAASYEHLGEAENLVYEVIQELTFLIQELYPMALKEKGLANTLREYIFEWEGQSDIHAEMQIEGEQRANLETEQALYRVVQEALANVARHSRASQVRIHVVCAQPAITIEISDNGQGFDPAVRPAGMGLRSMRERVEKIHGELRLESSPGQGTRLALRAPFKH